MRRQRDSMHWYVKEEKAAAKRAHARAYKTAAPVADDVSLRTQTEEVRDLKICMVIFFMENSACVLPQYKYICCVCFFFYFFLAVLSSTDREPHNVNVRCVHMRARACIRV